MQINTPRVAWRRYRQKNSLPLQGQAGTMHKEATEYT